MVVGKDSKSISNQGIRWAQDFKISNKVEVNNKVRI
jgi:hypothetical protein